MSTRKRVLREWDLESTGCDSEDESVAKIVTEVESVCYSDLDDLDDVPTIQKVEKRVSKPGEVDLLVRLPREVLLKKVGVYLVGFEDGASLRASCVALVDFGEAEALWPEEKEKISPVKIETDKLPYCQNLDYDRSVPTLKTMMSKDLSQILGSAYFRAKMRKTRQSREKMQVGGTFWKCLETFATEDLVFFAMKSSDLSLEQFADEDDVDFFCREASVPTCFENAAADQKAKAKWSRFLDYCSRTAGEENLMNCFEGVAKIVAEKLSRDLSFDNDESPFARRFQVFKTWAEGLQRALDGRFTVTRALRAYRPVALYAVRSRTTRPNTHLLAALKSKNLLDLDDLILDTIYTNASFDWAVDRLAKSPNLPNFDPHTSPLFSTLLALDFNGLLDSDDSAIFRHFRATFILPLRALQRKQNQLSS